MPSGLILVPLFAGYVFLHCCYLLRFRAQRQDGYRLLIESVIAGVPITLLAWALGAWIHANSLDIAGIEAACRNAPIPFLGTAILAGLSAPAIAGVINLVTPSMWSKWYVIQALDNGFLRLAHQATMEERPVSVTLKNRKVYIGYVIRTPSLRPGEQYITVMPLASGYRDANTADLVLTQEYARVYNTADLDPADFGVTVPLAEIATASLFDPSAYPVFQDPVVDIPQSMGRSAVAGNPE